MTTFEIERQWIVTARAGAGGFPDTRRAYNSTVFRPYEVIITITDDEGDDLRVKSAEASGLRVQKSGPGPRIQERWFAYTRGLEGAPGWINDLAAETLAHVREKG